MTANEKLLAWCSKYREATIHVGKWIDPCCPSHIELKGRVDNKDWKSYKSVIVDEYDVIGEDDDKDLGEFSMITIDQLIEKALEEWNKE